MDVTHFIGKDLIIPGRGISVKFSPGRLGLLKIEVHRENDEVVLYELFEVTCVSSRLKEHIEVEVRNKDSSVMGFLVKECMNLNMVECADLIYVSVYLNYIISCQEDGLGFFGTGEDVIEIPSLEVNFLQESFLFIIDDFYDEYVSDYKEGSELWGGFSHSPVSICDEEEIDQVIGISGLLMPTPEHSNKCLEIISSDNPFDRFLKKYQLMELLYDYVLVSKLRTSDRNIRNFRAIMGAYSREELASLRSLLNDYLTNYDVVCQRLSLIDSYWELADEIFNRSGKDSNPLKNEEAWAKVKSLVQGGKFNVVECAKEKVVAKCNSESLARSFICNLTAYWIYRVRCSIAHHKIGEFTFRPSDGEFITKFAEKVIDQVLIDIFSNENMKILLEKSSSIEQYLDSQ